MKNYFSRSPALRLSKWIVPDTPGKNYLNRRKFLKPWLFPHLVFNYSRHVLGDKNFFAPTIKLHLPILVRVHRASGIVPLLASSQFQVIAVCDPNKEAIGYKIRQKDWLKNEIRKTIEKLIWNPEVIIESWWKG